MPEDEFLVKPWVRISEVAIIGSGQKGNVLYQANNKFYNSTKHGYVLKRKDEFIERRVHFRGTSNSFEPDASLRQLKKLYLVPSLLNISTNMVREAWNRLLNVWSG